MGNQQLAATTESNSANAVELIENDTTVAARQASNSVVVEPFVKFAFRCEGFKNVFEGGCFSFHKKIDAARSAERKRDSAQHLVMTRLQYLFPECRQNQ